MGLTVNGRTATHMRVSIGAWGTWYVEASLDSGEPISGAAVVVANDLTLAGTVLSGGPDRGRAPVRIVGGKGGWGKVLPGRSYANDAGVKRATIARDAAQSCGESFDLASASGVVGASFTLREGPASQALDLVAPGAWYVGEDGVTRLGKRPARELPMGVTRVSNDPARGTSLLASESLSGLLPGLVVDGKTVVDVEHDASPTKVRTTVYFARQDASRLLDPWQRLFEAFDPLRHYRATWEYRVEGTEGKRLNLSPARKSTGMPSLLRVPVRAGAPGIDADYLRGTLVLVAFVDADPTRAAVVGFEDPRGSNFVPDELRLAEGTAGAARVGDSVTVTLINVQSVGGPASATAVISSGSSIVKVGG